MEKGAIKVWAVLFWLAVWQLVSTMLGSEILLVSPAGVLLRLWQLLPTADFWRAVFVSSFRISLGFLLAAAASILLGCGACCCKRIKELIAPAMLAIKSVPVASFIILALVWFSSKTLSTLISFLMVLPVLYSSVVSGIINCDKQMLEMAKVFKMPLFRRVRYIYIPQALPFFKSGCTAALGLCWKAGIAAEVIGMPTGSVGERLQQAKVYLDTPDLFAWTLVIVAVSMLFERIVMALLKYAERALARA